jgi:hypothetical protein
MAGFNAQGRPPRDSMGPQAVKSDRNSWGIRRVTDGRQGVARFMKFGWTAQSDAANYDQLRMPDGNGLDI